MIVFAHFASGIADVAQFISLYCIVLINSSMANLAVSVGNCLGGKKSYFRPTLVFVRMSRILNWPHFSVNTTCLVPNEGLFWFSMLFNQPHQNSVV